jgi:glucose/arabinose dehydrogenase
VAGSTFGFNDGAAAAAQFAHPRGIDVDDSGMLYVADTENERIRKVTPAGVVSTLAGSVGGFADGVGSAARLHRPPDVAVDSTGNVLFVGEINDRVRQATPAGVVSTLAGSSEGYVDGAAATAKFDSPFGVAVDSAGDVFVADAVNNAIRKLS